MVTSPYPIDSDAAARAALRYSTVAIVLHWVIALLIFYNLLSGLLRDSLPRGFFVFHVSSGITILVLSVVRVLWRLTHRPPPLLPMAAGERRLASGVHFLIYCAILLVPFTGWAMVSANPPAGSPGAAWATAQRERANPTPPPAAGQTAPKRAKGPPMVWGVVPLPMIGPINAMGQTSEGVPAQHELHETLETAHVVGAWLMLALIVLHVAGALKHQFVDRQRELARMGLGRTAPRAGD